MPAYAMDDLHDDAAHHWPSAQPSPRNPQRSTRTRRSVAARKPRPESEAAVPVAAAHAGLCFVCAAESVACVESTGDSRPIVAHRHHLTALPSSTHIPSSLHQQWYLFFSPCTSALSFCAVSCIPRSPADPSVQDAYPPHDDVHHNGLMDIDPSSEPPLHAAPPTPTASPPHLLKPDPIARMSVDSDDQAKVKFVHDSSHDHESAEREPVSAADCLAPPSLLVVSALIGDCLVT